MASSSRAIAAASTGATLTVHDPEALALIERVMGRSISVRRGEAGVAEPEQTRADVARAAEHLGFCNAISLEVGIQRQVAATLLPA